MSVVSDILEEPSDTASELATLVNAVKQPAPTGPYAVRLDMNPYQSSFITAPDKGFAEALYCGSVGGGKSLALCIALLRYVSIPNTTVLLCRLHLADLKKSTLRALLLPETQLDGSIRPALLPDGAIKSFNRTECMIGLHNNSTIICSGASDPAKIRSITASACLVDELTELEQDQYLAITQRCRVPCALPNTTFAATNPGVNGHWVHDRFFKQPDPSMLALTVSAYSNPYLPVDYIRRLERLPDDQRRRMLLGEWTAAGGAVFNHFSRSKHVAVCKEQIGKGDYILAQDYGGGKGGSAMLLLGRASNGHIYVCEEFWMEGPSHSKVLQWMEKHRAVTYSRVVPDSANSALITDMENAGWTCSKCVKDVEGSVAAVNSRFHDGDITIDPSCEHLIRELEQAVRNPDTGLISKLKDWDTIDAMRYGVCAFSRGDADRVVVKRTYSGF